ncbi:MAG: thioredoxin domain-containing protein, partial [bacterium]
MIAIVVPIFAGCNETDNREMEPQTEMTTQNHLAGSTSPYLLQHANNPVDWYPWGEEALQRARVEDKPIFLSIGYSACHWCHVMEHESFENPETATLMNEHFVCIKVDREERPDLDDIYMTFIQLSTGSGGWPMSVFLTPDLKPFFGGTYFPPEDRYGRPGFPNLLQNVATAWKTQRDQIEQSSEAFAARLQQVMGTTGAAGQFPENTLEQAAQQLLSGFDAVNGGFSGPPKFPPSYSLSLLMRYIKRRGDEQALRALTFTLDKMAQGGIYDQLGGGFHRYSVDTYWLVPHFEKMLYDNALLSRTYFEAYQLTGNDFYLRIGTEVLDYILRDMTDGAGGFHSSEDADSEGEEGKFYVWTPQEIVEALGEDDGKLVCDYFDVTEAGNFEDGKSILHVRGKAQLFAERYGLTFEELASNLAEARAGLLEARSRRIRPHKDDKVLADWNGLMLSSLARGYQLSGDEQYLRAANRCADFLRETMYRSDGLHRTYRQGAVGSHG